MSLLSRLCGPCYFSHGDTVKVLHGKTLHLQCARCHADLGEVLAGQKYRARKVKKAKRVKPADVLRIARKQA